MQGGDKSGSSIYVVNQGVSSKIIASKFKAYLMIILGLLVFGRALYRFFFQAIPDVEIMSVIGVIANIIFLVLLT